jgi:hypothetical protein
LGIAPSQPGTPVSPGFPGGISFPKGETHLDAMERTIRARQQEADERKRRTLAAYDIIGKQGAGLFSSKFPYIDQLFFFRSNF